MKASIPWPIDPKTKEPSVSLGLLVVSTLAMLIAIGLSMAGKIKDVQLVTEWWFGCAALYFGRRMKWSKGEAGPTEEKAGE